MRTRLCYLALVLVPLLAYGPLLLQGYGTPEDYLRLADGIDGTQSGILHGALAELAFFAVKGVAELAWVRGLAVLFVILAGVALWQSLERGGWGELDALAVALGTVLLPSAQLAAGWASAWPAVLAALLSLAGFAAAESELEAGGTRRSVGLLGGVLLYFAAAMCFLPNAIMALVPLAALTFSRPLRLAGELGKWFRLHALLMLLGVFSAWLVERWMMTDAGIADRTGLAERLVSLFSVAVPSSWALFLVGETGAWRVAGAVLALGVLAGVIYAARRQVTADERVQAAWLLALLGSLAIFSLVVVLAPHWHAGYRTIWPLAGVAVVAVAAAVRGVGDRPGKKPVWHYAALGGLIAAGGFAAATQPLNHLAAPLADEWAALRGAVLRANFVGKSEVTLVVTPAAERAAVAEPHFHVRIADHAPAAQTMFALALRERFPSGRPGGQDLPVRTVIARPEGTAERLVFDLTRGGN